MIVSALANHLWQSTWFALAAALLAVLVRKDTARIRYWIWLAASVKFLIPFSLLTWVGGQFIFQIADDKALLPYVQSVAAPLTAVTVAIGPITGGRKDLLLALWLLGTLVIVSRWLVQSSCARGIVLRGEHCDIRAPIPVLQSREISEPCVVGIFDPVLLWPAQLASQLTEQQLASVLAHEAGHVRRRDNLMAALHTLVTAAFWFHPLVWWIGSKLMEMREHACDEAALAEGHEPHAYAEAILRVCRHSVQARSACISRASDGDLNARIRCIMSEKPRVRLVRVRRAIACAALLGCVALPVAAGMNVVSVADIHVAVGTQSMRVSGHDGPSFINADDTHVYARNVSLRELIAHAYEVDAHDVTGPYDLIDATRYDLDLRSADGAGDARQLVVNLLEQQFNIEFTVRPTVLSQPRQSVDRL